MALMKEQQIDQVAELQKRIDAAVDQINAVIHRLEMVRETRPYDVAQTEVPFTVVTPIMDDFFCNQIMLLNGALDTLTEADDEPTQEICPVCDGSGSLGMTLDGFAADDVACGYCGGAGVLGGETVEA